MEAVVFMFFLAGVFFTWFFIHRARTKERMLLIEKGIDLSTLPKSGQFKVNFRFPWLKIGIIISCISLGCLIGVMYMHNYKQEIGEMLPPTFMFLFGGIGMILAHYLDKPKPQE